MRNCRGETSGSLAGTLFATHFALALAVFHFHSSRSYLCVKVNCENSAEADLNIKDINNTRGRGLYNINNIAAIQ